MPGLILSLFAFFFCLAIISEASRLYKEKQFRKLSREIQTDDYEGPHVLSCSVAVHHLFSSRRAFLKVVVFVVVLAQTGCAVRFGQHRKCSMNRCADSGNTGNSGAEQPSGWTGLLETLA